MNEEKIKIFEFKIKKKINSPYISEYSGWNGSKIIKIKLRPRQVIDNNFITKKFSSIANKEKILVLTLGQLRLKLTIKNTS